jgi:AcrR family transcriptional regulator
MSPARSPRRRRARAGRRYHHGNLRRALVDAAVGLVERHGAEALTLRAAARRAGVSPAAPYRHFADKRALLAAVAEEGFRLLTETLRGAGRPDDEPLERFRARGLGYVAFATTHPAHFRVMFGREIGEHAAYPTLREAAGQAFEVLVEGVAECQRVGAVRSGEPRELALASWSAVHGLCVLLVNGQLGGLYDASAGDLAATVTLNLFLGLGPR